MAYKISGSATDAGRAHIIKSGSYVGYKDVTAGAYDLVFEAADNANVMTVSEKSDGETVGYGGITAVPTVDAVNITLPSSGATISKIIRGTGDISGTTVNASLGDTVDISKSMLICTGSIYDIGNSTSTGVSRGGVALQLYSTYVYGRRWNNYTPSTRFGYMVVEYATGISSVQRGLLDWNNNTATPTAYYDITISAVDVDKTLTTFTHTYDADYNIHTSYGELTSSTNLRIYLSNSGYEDLVMGWEVVEFS